MSNMNYKIKVTNNTIALVGESIVNNINHYS